MLKLLWLSILSTKPPLVVRKDSRERDDHRMEDYPRSGGAASQSSRIHDQIAGTSPRRRGERVRY